MKQVCPSCKTVVKHWAKECPRCGAVLKAAPAVVRKGATDQIKDRPRWTK